MYFVIFIDFSVIRVGGRPCGVVDRDMDSAHSIGGSGDLSASLEVWVVVFFFVPPF